MKKLLAFLLITLALASQAQYIERIVPAVGDRAGFVGYFPAKWESGKKYPVLFLLHGIGECGTGNVADLTRLAKHLNYTAAETFGEQYGFIIVEPQANKNTNWTQGEIEETYQWLKDSLYDHINWKKVYLSGQSLGGGGVNHYLGINPDADKLFAAAAPSAAGPNQYFLQLDKYMTNLVNTKVPYWASHNRGDAKAPPSQSTLAIQSQLKARKGTASMWFTIFDLDGHTFPIFNRGKGNTLSDGLKYVVGTGLLINPQCNVYEWFLMNEIGKPAVAPPTVKLTVPGKPDLPTIPITQPTQKPDTVKVVHTFIGYNIYGDNLKIEPVFSDGSLPAIKGEAGEEFKTLWIPAAAMQKPTTTNVKGKKKMQVVK